MNSNIDFTQELLKELIRHEEWLDDSQNKKIKQAMAKSYYSHEMLSLFKDEPDAQRNFISKEVVSKFISTFSDEDIESKQIISDKVNVLLSFIKEVITPKVASDIVTKFRDLLNAENPKPYREEKENMLACIEDILNTFLEEIAKMFDRNILDSFINSIVQGMNALGDWEQKKIFVFPCLKVVKILKDPKKTEVANLIHNFLGNTNIDGIKFIFSKLRKEEKTQLFHEPQYTAAFQQIVQQQDVLDLLYPVAPKDIRTQWLISLINSVPQIALSKLEKLHYKVDNKVAIVDTLLNKALQASVQEKESFYNAINEMKCADDANLRATIATQIQDLLKNDDPNQQKIGHTTLENAAYLSDTAKRDIARETIEWLGSLQPDGASKPHSIKSVVLNWDILPQPPQRDFVDFIFVKLIINGINIANIKLGFETLSTINLKHKEYSIYFEDVSNKIEAEENTQIKSELINGLLKLRPKGTNRKNRDFWEKIDKLSAAQSQSE